MSKFKLAIKCFEQKIIALATEEYQLRRSKYFLDQRLPRIFDVVVKEIEQRF